nr:glycosyltransferase family 4 protein [uncultured Chitinophaga sp.]
MSEKKCLIILEDSGKSDFGGGQRVTLTVIDAIRDRYELILCDTRKKTTFQELAAGKVNRIVKMNSYGKIANRKVAAFNISLLEITLFPIHFSINFLRLLRVTWAKRKRPALMYATTKKSLIYACFLHKITGVPYVFHAHSYDANASGGFMGKLYRSAAKIVCVSDFIKQSFKFSNTVTIYNPVTIPCVSEARRLPEKRPVTVATFSRLLKMKGIDYFMDSVKYLKHHQQVRYLIYGEGPEKEHLEKLATEQTELMGFVADIGQALESVDIVVVPSIAEESFGMTSIEAFAKGIPVISTNIGGQAEIVKDGLVGFHVPVEDSKAIAEKIDYLMEHPDVYQQFSGRALDYVQQFDEQHFADHVTKLFETEFK